MGEVSGDEHFDHRSEHADPDVAFDPLFGPVVDGTEMEEVFEDPEPMLDVGELTVGKHHLGGGGLGGGEAGGEHIPTGKELFFVVEGVFVVVVEEVALFDFDVEEAGHPQGTEDALGGPADLGGMFEPAVPHPLFQRQQSGFGAGHQLGGAGGVSGPTVEAGHHHRALPVGQGDVTGGRVGVWHRHPPGVGTGGRFQGFSADGVTVQAGGQHMIESPGGEGVEVVPRDESPVGHHQILPTPNRSPRSVRTPGRVATSAVFPANT